MDLIVITALACAVFAAVLWLGCWKTNILLRPAVRTLLVVMCFSQLILFAGPLLFIIQWVANSLIPSIGRSDAELPHEVEGMLELVGSSGPGGPFSTLHSFRSNENEPDLGSGSILW